MKLWRCTAILLMGIVMSGVGAVRASEEGRRNTAIALTAGAIAAFAKNKDTIGLGLAAGSAYAWKRYDDARDARKKREAAAHRTRSAPVYGYSGRTSSSRPAARLASYPTSQRRSRAASSGTSRGPVDSQSALAAQKAELARLKTDYAAQQKKQQELQAQLAALQARTLEMEQKQQQNQAAMAKLAEENRKLQAEVQQRKKQAGAAWGWTLAGLGPLAGLGLWSGLRQLRRYRFQVVPAQGA